jgi:ribosome-associated toxin RatA of RatAB toxin-antitoxin module
MTDKVEASVDIGASSATVWALVSDVTRMPEFSPELRSAQWISAVAEPTVGARFKGSNKHGISRWSTSCEVIAAEPGVRFTYRVSSFGLKVSEWSFDIEPTSAGCRLTESTVDRRGFIMKYVGGPATGVLDRARHNLSGIRTTLDAIKATAEKDAVTA